MKCSKCSNKGIYHKQEVVLCKEHFQKMFEEEFRKNLPLLKDYDNIGVGVSGGKDSLTLLYLCKKILPEKKIVGICIDEGISNYREQTLERLRKYCEEWNIEYYVFSFREEFGETLDNMTDKIKNTGNPCSYCGILRRHLLNIKSKDLGVECILTGHNLDDEAQSVMMNFFTNDYNRMIRLGVKSGVQETEHFIPRIKPFRNLSEKEVMTYFISKRFRTPMKDCPYARVSFRARVRNELNKIEKDNPVKKKIINGFDKLIKPLKDEHECIELKKCECGNIKHEDCSVCRIKKIIQHS